MKRVFIDCSPKKKNSTSSYIMWHVKSLLGGKKIKYKLLPKNYDNIIKDLNDADMVVMSTPTYVDGLPGSVVSFLEYAENKITNNNLKLYAISNCGFYEGHQNDNTLAMFKAWSEKAKINYCGGIGYGAGEMIGIIRFFNIFLAFMILFIELLIGGIKMLVNNNFTFTGLLQSVNVISVVSNIIVFFIFNIFLYIYSIKVANKVRKGKTFKNYYTTVFCPRFLFVVFADLFWIIKAMLRKVPIWKLYKK